MNRIFLTLSRNDDLPNSFLTDRNNSSLPAKKYHLLDAIPPFLSTKIEELDGCTDIQFVGHCTNGECVCYVDQYGDENLTNFYVYNFEKQTRAISRYCLQSIQNIRGSRSYDDEILSSDRTFCLLFSKERSNIHVSVVSFGKDFKSHDFRDDILVLSDCRRGSKYCLSPSNNLLTIVQCYHGNVFTYLSVHFVQLVQHVTGTVSAKLLSNETLQITHNSKLLDCQVICNCSKVVFITDSHSEGNVFTCCSVSPFVKLFVTKIQCSRENGWFFIEDPDRQGDKLITFKNMVKGLDGGFENGTSGFDGLVEIFSCDDNRNFIPLKRFLISELLGCRLEQPVLNVSVYGYRLFLCIARQVYIVDLNSQSLMFTLVFGGMSTPRTEQPIHSLKISTESLDSGMERSVSPTERPPPTKLSAVTVSCNQTEVIINQSFTSEESCYQMINVYTLPGQRFTLFGLCRLSLLKSFTKAQLMTTKLPRHLKNVILSLKSNYYKT